jgi:hypothetical protein
MPRLLLLCCLLPMLVTAAARAEVPPLLQEAVDKLTDERQRWAFTQRVREYDGDELVRERLERFDPSRGNEHRWQLLRLNGREATAREAEAWSQRKNRVRKRPPKEVSEYVDLEQAKVREENDASISYEVPFRRSAGGLFPGDKVALTLTLNKQSGGIERAQVSIYEPFKVALGLAQIVDLDLDLEVTPSGPSDDPGGAADKPRGTASAVVNKFGRRIEYLWTDFTRHESIPAPVRP